MTKQKITVELPDKITASVPNASGLAVPPYTQYLYIDTPEVAAELIERVRRAKLKVSTYPPKGKMVGIDLPDGVNVYELKDKKGVRLMAHSIDAAKALKVSVDVAVEKAKRPAGMPEDGQEVLCLLETGIISPFTWKTNGDAYSRAYWEMGNVFYTYESAGKECERRRALQRVKVWIAENTEPGFDWIHDKSRCYIVHEPGADRFLLMQDQWMMFPIVGGVPMMRESDALRLIESCESDLRVLAGAE